MCRWGRGTILGRLYLGLDLGGDFGSVVGVLLVATQQLLQIHHQPKQRTTFAENKLGMYFIGAASFTDRCPVP